MGEDRGDVIGLDVQDKVMEDITQGVLAICGNSGARNKVSKKMKVADGKVRKALIRDDVKTELQRRFESISVRDHMTNLYAPRLIVEKTMTDQQRHESVVSKEGSDDNGIKAVERRQKAARDMELEVLKEEGLNKDTERLLAPQQDCGDAVIQIMKAQYASVQAKKNQNQA